jgi:pyridoxal phosphate enzyme (YggS family)
MVAEGLTAVRARMAAAASRSGRDVDAITLVAVSKGHGVDAIREVYDAGHRDFGENRAQELVAKAPDLPDDIRWHFVGSLQRRKAKLVRPWTTLLHSMDRPSLAAAWAHETETAPPVLIQVNLGREPQKGGVMAEDVADLLVRCRELGLRPEGLMAIPPAPEVAEDSRRWFDMLGDLQSDLAAEYPSLVELSMGMTDDYEVAIEAGSSMIRVGRAIFGPRPTG